MNNGYKVVILSIAVAFGASFGGVTSYAQGTTCTDLKATMSLGSSSASVTQLQNFLRAQGFLSSKSTGYFGPLTFKAVQSFQTSQHLPVVGIVGPLTRASIKTSTCSNQPTTTAQSNSNTQINSNVSLTAAAIQSVTSANISNTSFVQLPLRAYTFDNWTGVAGNVSTTSLDTLLVKAATTSQSAEALFPASNNWIDYKYTADVTITNGEVSLISRYVDQDNYMACVFYSNIIDLRQHLNGQTTTLASTQVHELSDMNFFQKSMSISMRVQGDSVGCSELGGTDNVSTTGIDKSLLKGGIGIATWFTDPGAATLELRDINVVSL